jgi:hypothetical protein
MPLPIQPVNQNKKEEPDNKPTSMFDLLQMVMNPITVLQDSLLTNRDKVAIKDVWLKSEALDNGKLKVDASITDRDLLELIGRGLIEGSGRVVSFTTKGEKVLKEAILNDEVSALQKKASLIKKASKKLVAKNSFDFGDEVLVRTESKERLGTRYISIPKKAFLAKGNFSPMEIDSYDISTRKDGKYKKLKDYSENELIKVLHLAKSIIANHKDISVKLASNGKFANIVPINRLKAFATFIMEELNSR